MNSAEQKTGHCACSSFGKWVILAIVIALALGVLSWATAERRKNIMKTATELPECSTFVELVGKAGMTPILEKDGPFTVFIPTNEAFAKIPQERLTEILNDKSALAAVLLYHMTPRAMSLSDLEKPVECETCVVPKTEIMCSQEKFGDAVYIQKNIPCVNGVVYIVDTVQIPPFLTSGQPAPPQPAVDEISVVETEEVETLPAPASTKPAKPADPAPVASAPTEPAPAPTEPAPAPTEPAPTPTEPAPTPTEPAPTPTEPAPVPTEPAPTPTEPAPNVPADSTR